MKAEDILETALAVLHEREEQHGKKTQNLQMIAALWSIYLNVPVSASEVAQMMVLLKIARSQNGNYNPDDFVDAVGYAALAGEAATW